MSVKSKQLELLDYIDSWLGNDSSTKLTFACCCYECPRSDVVVFENTSQVRNWLNTHHANHENSLFVQVKYEGITFTRVEKAKEEDIFSDIDSDLVASKLDKLRALAAGTPYAEEADVAIRKIRDIEEKLLNR